MPHEFRCTKCKFHDTPCPRSVARVRLTDREGRLIWVNQHKTPIPAHAMLGKLLWSIPVKAEQECMRRAFRKALRHDQCVELIRRDHINLRLWHVRIEPAMGVGSEVGALVSTFAVCDGLPELSPSQRVVLRLLATGTPIALIAEEMAVTINTVRTQLTRARRKLGKEGLNDLAVWANIHHQVLLSDLGPLLSPVE